MLIRHAIVPVAAATLFAGLTGCTAKQTGTTAAESTAAATGASSSASSDIAVDATDTACGLSTTRAAVGKHSFVVTNNGAKVTEFYVYGPDNAVLAEVENIPPGLRRTLDIDFTKPGTYRTACKPGMVGDGISTELTITD